MARDVLGGPAQVYQLSSTQVSVECSCANVFMQPLRSDTS